MRITPFGSILALACPFVLSCSDAGPGSESNRDARPQVVAIDTQARAGELSVVGRVFAGQGVKRRPAIKITIDDWACGHGGKTPDPRLVLGPDRGLADVVVTLVEPPDKIGWESAPEVVVDQQACVFQPHVSVVAPGTQVKVTNGDKVFHNFRTRSELNQKVNKGQPGGIAAKVSFPQPEVIVAECDVHHWMSAVIVVAPHRFVAVSDARGRFRFDGLAAGEYRAKLWHQELGEREVLLKAGSENPAISWTLSAAQSP